MKWFTCTQHLQLIHRFQLSFLISEFGTFLLHHRLVCAATRKLIQRLQSVSLGLWTIFEEEFYKKSKIIIFYWWNDELTCSNIVLLVFWCDVSSAFFVICAIPSTFFNIVSTYDCKFVLYTSTISSNTTWNLVESRWSLCLESLAIFRFPFFLKMNWGKVSRFIFNFVL